MGPARPEQCGSVVRLRSAGGVQRGGGIDTHYPAPELHRAGANPVLVVRGAP